MREIKSEKSIEIIPINNGWIVILPKVDKQEKMLKDYSKFMEKLISPEQSEIEKLQLGSDMKDTLQNQISSLIPDDSFADDVIHFFPTLLLATAFIEDNFNE